MNTKSVKFSDLTSALAALVLYRGSSRLLCTAINWISLHCTVFTCTGRCHRLIAHCTVLNYNTLEDAVCVWFAFQIGISNALLYYWHIIIIYYWIIIINITSSQIFSTYSLPSCLTIIGFQYSCPPFFHVPLFKNWKQTQKSVARTEFSSE